MFLKLSLVKIWTKVENTAKVMLGVKIYFSLNSKLKLTNQFCNSLSYIFKF